MFTKIRVISIPVINQQVALEFYRDVLGARVEADVPFDQDGQQRWISLVLPGVDTRISLVTWFPQLGARGAPRAVASTTTEVAATTGSATIEADKIKRRRRRK